MKRVLCAMSGGVDSSVAAAVLIEQGFDVVGVTMKLWRGDSDPFAAHRYGGCCTIGATEDARRVADRLDIPYYVINLQEEFDAAVVDNFIDEYAGGRTPNPCARCNQFIKFNAFYDRAAELGCDYIATGHYARIDAVDGRFRLRRGVDHGKDQSYMLGMLTQAELSRTLFPIGHIDKQDTRLRAAELGLCVAEKPDSQEICFVEDGDHARFVRERVSQLAVAGPIVDETGRKLGEHSGLASYTVGQRKGIGISAPAPLFVLRIDASSNSVVVGPRSSLAESTLRADGARWTSETVKAGAVVEAQTRAHSRAVAATVLEATSEAFTLRFENDYFGIAPGQMCVLYLGDEVLGSGTIQ